MAHDATPPARDNAPRTGKELFDATRPFAVEHTARSWWTVSSTLFILIGLIAIVAISPWWPVRLAASIFTGLLMVRSFILYHDHIHRALLRNSRLASIVFQFFGMLLLAPTRHWRASHNFHHGHVGKPLHPDEEESLLVTSDIGSFPLMTIESWQAATPWQRLGYRISRHPLTLLFAYFTVFMGSLTIVPFVKDPRKHWDGGVALLLHGSVIAAIWVFFGFAMAFYCFILPVGIASALGAYLFFAQHNYEGMHIFDADDWSYYRGATESSSFMRLGAIMHWITGNIGYHHIHHLNPLIPFYRLPEAMAAIPELQHPTMTSLHPRDIYGCLRLNLWDANRETLVSYREGRHRAA